MFALRIFLVSIFFSQLAVAGESLYLGIRHQFEGIRAQGMGGAFVGLANDNTAIFYNPAGLSQLTEGESNWFMKFDTDPELKDLYDDIDQATNNPPAGQSDEEALASVLQEKYGTHYSSRIPTIGWLWGRPNWGLAVVLADFSLDMALHRTVGPSINLLAVNDTTVAFSYNWHIKQVKYGKLVVGTTAKAIYRMEVNKVVSIAQISDDDIFRPEDAKEGLAVDADVGVLWTAPWKSWKLNTGMVIRNIADIGYIAQMNLVGKQSGKPDPLGRTIDFGASVEAPKWWVFTNRIALDFRDFLHPNFSMIKGLHVGYEAAWDVTSWWRGAWRVGLNQGYWTAGFTGEFAVFRLDLASYGEEVGVAGSEIENRRYMLSMSLDF